MGWISIAGILLFLTSFAYFMIKQDRNENIELTIAAFVLGFVMAALGSIFHETIRKKGWPTIRAQCLDHETKFGRTPDNHKIWTMRLLCRFRIDEQEIECTPEVFWPKRKGEEWKRSYLAEDSEGALFCSLLVNPENPHETYLLARKEPNQSR